MFDHLKAAPADPILGMSAAFKADECPKKVDLGVGAYRDVNGKPYVFDVVRKVDKEIAAANLNKEYQPIDGEQKLKAVTAKLIFGEFNPLVESGRLVSLQSLSGTGALRTALEFIKRNLPGTKSVYVSDPTWPNHVGISAGLGFDVVKYAYWDQSMLKFNIDKMLASLSSAQAGSLVILHACAHNPVGSDPTIDEWRRIAEVCRDRNLLPLLDCAYQGFASGDLENDSFSIRLFEQLGFEFFVCQSFAKNMGLYGERMGMVHVVCRDQERASVVLSQIKPVVRQSISNPPIHPARLALGVLSDPSNCAAWKSELKNVAGRIIEMRQLLRQKLETKGTPGTWKHITEQIGMFSFTGLSQQACERMTDQHHIYMTKNGRISMAGVNPSNIDYIVESIDESVRFTNGQ